MIIVFLKLVIRLKRQQTVQIQYTFHCKIVYTVKHSNHIYFAQAVAILLIHHLHRKTVTLFFYICKNICKYYMQKDYTVFRKQNVLSNHLM